MPETGNSESQILNEGALKTLELAPFGYLYLDDDLQVQFANQYARSLTRYESGSNIHDFIHPDARADFETLVKNRNPSHTIELQLLLDIGSKAIQASCASNQMGGIDLFIQNISESKILGRQLQETSKPARKFVHDISNALASTVGYSELLSMMLSEDEMLAGEKLSAIRRYQVEVREGLERAESLIRRERARKDRTAAAGHLTTNHEIDELSSKRRESQDASERQLASKFIKQHTLESQFLGEQSVRDPSIRRKDQPLIRRHIVIVDDESSIAEFLAELMRSQHYKTTIFTSSPEAYEYLVQNNNKVDLIILDQMMPNMTGIDLATNLLSMDISTPVVLCTGDSDLIANQSQGSVNIKNFIRKPVDITDLMNLVGSILSK